MEAISTWWLVGMGTLLVGAMVIMVMRARVELLIGRASTMPPAPIP